MLLLSLMFAGLGVVLFLLGFAVSVRVMVFGATLTSVGAVTLVVGVWHRLRLPVISPDEDLARFRVDGGPAPLRPKELLHTVEESLARNEASLVCVDCRVVLHTRPCSSCGAMASVLDVRNHQDLRMLGATLDV